MGRVWTCFSETNIWKLRSRVIVHVEAPRESGAAPAALHVPGCRGASPAHRAGVTVRRLWVPPVPDPECSSPSPGVHPWRTRWSLTDTSASGRFATARAAVATCAMCPLWVPQKSSAEASVRAVGPLTVPAGPGLPGEAEPLAPSSASGDRGAPCVASLLNVFL